MQYACKAELALANERSPGTSLQVIRGGGRQESDEELVIAAQSGDSSALGELLARHRKMLYCFARRYTANEDEAHDLVQETMLRAVRNILRFRRESRFVTWLCSIVVNKALSDKRREKLICWINLNEQEGETTRPRVRCLRDVRRNPEEDYSHRELRGLLLRHALKLRPRDRFIWKSCDLDDLSIKEVAGALGMHPAATKSRLQRARRSLSAAMKKSTTVCTNLRTRQPGD
jgi:RNA polymerase sigma-70 factor (ECF subfamily)